MGWWIKEETLEVMDILIVEGIGQSKLVFSSLKTTIFIYKAFLAGMSSKHLLNAG